MSAAGSVSAVSGGGILAQIVARRRARVDREGHAAGMLLPARREGQPVAFGADPFLVCEVKRRSPSRGEIDGTDPVERARRYAAHGVRSISVLTEQDTLDGGDVLPGFRLELARLFTEPGQTPTP